jgi:hypothetical protein
MAKYNGLTIIQFESLAAGRFLVHLPGKDLEIVVRQRNIEVVPDYKEQGRIPNGDGEREARHSAEKTSAPLATRPNGVWRMEDGVWSLEAGGWRLETGEAGRASHKSQVTSHERRKTKKKKHEARRRKTQDARRKPQAASRKCRKLIKLKMAPAPAQGPAGPSGLCVAC